MKETNFQMDELTLGKPIELEIMWNFMHCKTSIKCSLVPGASLPTYATDGASGCDLRANEEVMIYPGKRYAVRTGLFLAIPPGGEAQVRPRSGLALKHGVTVLNSPGTVDSDYRGEVRVLLINHGDAPFEVKNGDRIAQLVFAQTIQAKFSEVDVLDDTDRGTGGFGSTGAK